MKPLLESFTAEPLEEMAKASSQDAHQPRSNAGVKRHARRKSARETPEEARARSALCEKIKSQWDTRQGFIVLADSIEDAHINLRKRGYHKINVLPATSRHSQRGKAPAAFNVKEQYWYMTAVPGSVKDIQTVEDLMTWRTSIDCPPNVGIICGLPASNTYVCALDIDVHDAALVSEIRKVLQLETEPMRVGRRGGLFAFRSDTPTGGDYRQPDKDEDGNAVLVQKLGYRKQWVCTPSVHPNTGQPYKWDDGSELPPPVYELPLITDADLRRALAQLGFKRGKERTEDQTTTLSAADARNEEFLSSGGYALAPEDIEGVDASDNEIGQANAVAKARSIMKTLHKQSRYTRGLLENASGDASATMLRGLSQALGRAFKNEFESHDMARRAAATVMMEWLEENSSNPANASDRFVAKCLTQFDIAYAELDYSEAFLPAPGDDKETLEAKRTKRAERTPKTNQSPFEMMQQANRANIERLVKRGYGTLLKDGVPEPHDFLYGGFYIRGIIMGTVAQGGVGKTQLLLTEALAMATGRNLCGYDIQRPNLRVLYFNGEDDIEELERRAAALCRHYNIDFKEARERLELVGAEFTVKFAMQTRDGFWKDDDGISMLIDYINDGRFDVAIFDPLVTFHQSNEVDPASVQGIADVFKDIGRRTRAAIHIAHHPRKVSSDSEVSAIDMRGATPLHAAARGVRTINKLSKEDRARFPSASHPESFIRVGREDDKANLMRAVKHGMYFELTSHDLKNGKDGIRSDHIGVPVRRKPESLNTIGDVLEYQEEVERNFYTYKGKEDWFGWWIMARNGIDPAAATDGQKRAATLAIKQLVESGYLKIKRQRRKGKDNVNRHEVQRLVKGDVVPAGDPASSAYLKPVGYDRVPGEEFVEPATGRV